MSYNGIGLFPLERFTPSAGAVEVTGLLTEFPIIEMHFGLQFATAGSRLTLRTSNNGGASYDSGATDYAYQRYGGPSGVAWGGTGSPSLRMTLSDINNTARGEVKGTITIIRSSVVGGLDLVKWDVGYELSTGTLNTIQGAGVRSLAGYKINAVRLFEEAGNNISDGWVMTWGRKET